MPRFGVYNPDAFGYPELPKIVPFKYADIEFYGGMDELCVGWFTDVLDAIHLPAVINLRQAGGNWGYEYRPVRNGTTLSFHGRGRAIDVMAVDNPSYSASWLKRMLRRNGPHTLPDGIGPIIRRMGGEWGGDWTSPKDYMHIECHLTYSELVEYNRRRNIMAKLDDEDRAWIHDEFSHAISVLVSGEYDGRFTYKDVPKLKDVNLFIRIWNRLNGGSNV